MKRLLISLTLMLLAGCAAATQATREELTYQKVLVLPQNSKEEIFEKSKQWVASTFKSAKAVLEYENKTDGVIIGNGSMPRPQSVVNPMGTNLISYSMREDIKDGKARLTFEKMAVYGYSPAFPGEYPVLAGDLEGMRLNFDLLTDDLQRYILESKAADKW